MSKPKPYTHWVFCDESGNLSNIKNRYLIGAAIGTSDPSTLRKVVDQIKKDSRPSIPKGTALHATDLPSKMIMDFLKRIARIDNLTLSVAILDKQWIWNQNIGDNYLYNEFFAYLIQQTLMFQMNAIATQSLVILEKRYNTGKYQSDLVAKIGESTSLEPSQIQLSDKNHHQWGQPLQVADSIAWSTYQKYEKLDRQFFDIFKDKIQLEQLLGVDGKGIIRPISEMNN